MIENYLVRWQSEEGMCSSNLLTYEKALELYNSLKNMELSVGDEKYVDYDPDSVSLDLIH